MAGPSKYTPERVERIIAALRNGNTRGASASYGGIDHDTLNNWCKRYSEFSAAVKKAESDAEVESVARIRKAASEGTWQAAAWWLERRRAEDWRQKQDVNVGGQHGNPIEVRGVDYATAVTAITARPEPDNAASGKG